MTTARSTRGQRASGAVRGDAMHLEVAERHQRAAGGGGAHEIDGIPLAARIARLAERQDGIADHAQLVALGWAPRAIGRAVENGRLTPVFRGVYAIGHGPLTPRARAVAALRAAGSDAVLSHGTAAALWRMAPWPDAVHVTVPRRPPRARPGLETHAVAAWERGDVRHRDGLSVTSPERTLLDLAATGAEGLDRAFAEAQVLRLVRGRDLARLNERAAGRPGAVALRRALDAGRRGPTRSDLERAMLAVVDAARLPRPVVNAPVGRFRPDFCWPEHRVIVETDGWAAHGHRRAFEHDRERDAELAADGYVVLRVTWRQLTEQPVLVAAQLASVLSLRAPARARG